MKNFIKKILATRLAPLFVIFIGICFAFIISISSPKPKKGIEFPKPTPVFYEELKKQDVTLRVKTNGEVKPLNEINLISQVSGKIIDAADEFVDGGIIKAGSPLVWVDDRDYQLAVISAGVKCCKSKKIIRKRNCRKRTCST